MANHGGLWPDSGPCPPFGYLLPASHSRGKLGDAKSTANMLGGHSSLRHAPPMLPAMAGHLSMALAHCWLEQTPFSRAHAPSREHNALPLIPCRQCTGLYNVARGTAEEEAEEVDT